MKKFITILLTTAMLLVATGCGDGKEINGRYCPTYGFFEDKPCPDAQYQVVAGNIIWSILLVETLIAPVLILGLDMYEPVAPLPGAVIPKIPYKGKAKGK